MSDLTEYRTGSRGDALSPRTTRTERWSIVFDGGDYDARSLPGVNDLDAYDARATAERERVMVARENGYPVKRYLLVRSTATPWEVVSD